MVTSLTYSQACVIYDNVRSKPNEKPNLKDFKNGILSEIYPDRENLEEVYFNDLSSKIDLLYRNITRYYENKRKRKKVNLDMGKISISVDSYPKPKKARTSKPLEELLSPRHRYRRIQPVIDMIKVIAKEEQTTEHYLLGLITRSIYYTTDKYIADIGNNLMYLQRPEQISVEAASNIKSYNNLGREGYQREIRALQTSGIDILPAWKCVKNFENSVTPKILQLPEGLGVEYNYREAIEITTKRILNVLDHQQIPEEMTLEIKDGLDGSGSHSIFNQNGNKDTHNLVMFMFTPLKLTTIEANSVIWEEVSPSSPNSCRVLSIMLGKETDESLKNLYEVIASQRSELQSSPLSIVFNEKIYKIKINFKMTMIDGKFRKVLMGLGGAFCLLCTCTRNEAACPFSSFIINRTGEQINTIWGELSSGDLKKKPHDYPRRLGVTRKPLINYETIASISPLHAGLRFFDTLLKLIYHVNAGVFNWSEEKNVLGDDFENLKNSKIRVRSLLKEKAHISVDMPDATGKGGTTTTGNVVHSLLSNEENLKVLVAAVPEEFQDSLHECLTRAYVIMKLYNSTHLINIESYKSFCSETKQLLLTAFNKNEKEWVFLTPTVHALLEHSGELIEANNGKGLGAYTESSLESNNKFLRIFRISLSRKTSQIDNLNDCMNRLWIRSDVQVRTSVPEKKCFKRSISDYRYLGPLPLISLADYYIKDLVED